MLVINGYIMEANANMDNNTKSMIMDEIERKAILFKKISGVQYTIRCPFCGDSGKNLKDMHCYVKCDYTNPDEPIKYNCFLCNRGGRNVSKLLKALNANPDIITLAGSMINNRIEMIKSSDINVITDNPNMDSPQVKFINRRLGDGLTYEDFAKFRIIWDMNQIRSYITDVRKLNTLPNNTNRINFISDNKSMILSRSFEESDISQWRKVQLFNNSKSFYIMQTTLDLFTSDTITINIAEGILDIISAYKNFNTGDNSVYIASLGSNYMSALNYLIMKGFIGKNINVVIYIDHKIDKVSLFKEIKRHKWMFNSIKVYENTKYKDIGVRIEKIKLREVRA